MEILKETRWQTFNLLELWEYDSYDIDWSVLTIETDIESWIDFLELLTLNDWDVEVRDVTVWETREESENYEIYETILLWKFKDWKLEKWWDSQTMILTLTF